MIASLHGTLVRKSPTEIVIDVQGVGYGVSIPLSTFEVLGDLNTFTSRVTNVTNPPPPPSTTSYRSGGGGGHSCACACACAGCACACAGGGR